MAEQPLSSNRETAFAPSAPAQKAPPDTAGTTMAATTRAAYRMTIVQEARTAERCPVVEYVTGPGKALEKLMHRAPKKNGRNP